LKTHEERKYCHFSLHSLLYERGYYRIVLTNCRY